MKNTLIVPISIIAVAAVAVLVIKLLGMAQESSIPLPPSVTPPADLPSPATSTTSSSTDGVADREEILHVQIDQDASGLGVKVAPLEVVEDSRCPIDVQCIQAGTVRVRTLLISGLGQSEVIFKLDTPVSTEAEEVTLVKVTPERVAGKNIVPGQYRFEFKVKKR